MSVKGVRNFLGDLVIYPQVRKDFQADPKSVLSKYDLTPAESKNLAQLKAKKIEQLKVQDLAPLAWGAVGGSILVGVAEAKTMRPKD